MQEILPMYKGKDTPNQNSLKSKGRFSKKIALYFFKYIKISISLNLSILIQLPFLLLCPSS